MYAQPYGTTRPPSRRQAVATPIAAYDNQPWSCLENDMYATSFGPELACTTSLYEQSDVLDSLRTEQKQTRTGPGQHVGTVWHIRIVVVLSPRKQREASA